MPKLTTTGSRRRPNPWAEALQIYGHLGSRLFDAYYDAAREMRDLWFSPRTPVMRAASAVNRAAGGLVSGLMAAARGANDETQEIILDGERTADNRRPRHRRERPVEARRSGAARD